MLKGLFTLILCIITSLGLLAQTTNDNCVNAQNLCPNTTFSGSTTTATTEICAGCADANSATGNFCFAINNTVWFSFTTNNVGGNATVDFTNISCLTGAGMDDEIQAVILQAGTPCDESTYSAVSNCENGTNNDFSLNAIGLNPNTTYYIQVNGDLNGAGITTAAQCDFSIEVSGPAVDVTITTNSTPANCGASDGTVNVISVDGATNPLNYAIDNGNFQSGTNFTGLNAGTHEITVQDANGCLFFEEEIVAQVGGPDNSSSSTTNASCTGNDGQIQVINTIGGTAPYTYTLIGGGTQSSNTFSNLPAGDYTIIISDQSSCTDTVVAIIANTSGITGVDAVIVNTDCGDATGSITLNVLAGNAPFQYSLNSSPNQSSNTFSNLSAGSYSATITDASGCTFLLTNIIVEDNAPNLTPIVTISQSPNPGCIGQPVDFTATVTNGGASTNYEWFLNGSSVQNGGSAVYSASNFTTGNIVYCIVTSNDPCLAITTDESNQIVMTVIPLFTPTTTLVSSAATSCEGEQVTFTATSDCTGGGTYEWYVNGNLNGTTSSNINPITIGSDSQVSVILNCSDACAQPSTSNSVNVDMTELNVDAGVGNIITPGETTVLNGSAAAGASYSWSPTSSLSNPNIPNPTASPTVTTTYILTVTANGCTATDDVTIIVANLINAPNTFTPNGDGFNDTWTIGRIEEYPNCKVTIYDRWGQKVFNTVGYTNANAWDGTNNGLKLPASTYFYVIDLNSGMGSKFDLYNGSITIVY